ncbi:MAG: RnfABCDGE type electron transport complex subunit D [Enterococcaceae bacterium]|jgi:electron transport complex protein RnfD|nr:RnfABCDGE type electron transport complex subunit D [Enterococcaceae bacterium]MCI1919946.1 RnfABCDGE type electron transport complex subunit D [Enterococcaceae bacterium]
MEQNNLYVSTGPHILGLSNTQKIMGSVTLALVPTAIASVILYGFSALTVTAASVGACVFFEWLWNRLRNERQTISDLSAIVTGLLLAFNLPASFPLWMTVVGAFFAIIITKQLFGGIGKNFANPAIVARIILQLSFTGAMMNYIAPRFSFGAEAVSGATPLQTIGQGQSLDLLNLLVGARGGMLGESCSLTILAGGIFLIFVKVIQPTIPFWYVGSTFVFGFLLKLLEMPAANALNLAFQSLFSGGLLLGAFFMATDYTTSPYTLKGKRIFAISLAIVTVAIRQWGNMDEGVSYALLVVSLFVPYMNRLTRVRPLGVPKKGAD